MSLKFIEDYILSLKQSLDEISAGAVEEAADAIADAVKKGKRVFIFGNGGSAATASHFAGDLSKGTVIPGGAHLPAFSLTDNSALLTAISNDIGYSQVFKEQLMALVGAGDIAIGISASGNSPNVLDGVSYAKSQGALTLGLCGFGGGKLGGLADKAIIIRRESYEQVEDVHLTLAHLLTQMVHRKLQDVRR